MRRGRAARSCGAVVRRGRAAVAIDFQEEHRAQSGDRPRGWMERPLLTAARSVLDDDFEVAGVARLVIDRRLDAAGSAACVA
ncbi:MAG: hypothetical protein ABJA98_02280 [Acidobacteriota bacterium]